MYSEWLMFNPPYKEIATLHGYIDTLG